MIENFKEAKKLAKKKYKEDLKKIKFWKKIKKLFEKSRKNNDILVCFALPLNMEDEINIASEYAALYNYELTTKIKEDYDFVLEFKEAGKINTIRKLNDALARGEITL